MSSPLYQQFMPQNNLASMLAQIKQNPRGMLCRKYQIPQNINDPNDILQHLLNTHQVSQDQVNRLMQMKNNPQIQQLFK